MKIIYTFNKDQVHMLHALYENEWWTKNRTLTETQACIDGSQISIGLVNESGVLQGFARVLTDYIFKALIFDLIVSDNHRGKGLGNKLLLSIKKHPELKSVKHFELYCLPEISGFYEKYGFSSDVGNIQLMRFINR